ncbi:MAG: cell division protein FtsZ [Candidatus Deianiraeaceae bacterium]|jgi:cell division protein FtsZ
MVLKFGGVQSVAIKPKIVVFGVGGGGCNAINHMIKYKVDGVDFIVANTDAQSLDSSMCENKIQLGSAITGGLGAGSVPDIGKRSAEESVSEIEDYIRDANMVFVAAGMGGGTGTGAAPFIAKIAKERGILTIGVVTKPFSFERDKRMKVAQEGVEEMRKYCDTTIVIANQNLFRIANAETTLTDAFTMADNVLVSGIRCVTDLITNSGLINLDFADVSVIMSDMGYAVMGEGEGTGEERAIRAAENAMTNPLLEESSIKGATGLLINITSGNDITLFEINDIIDRITSEVDSDANVKFGSIVREDSAGLIRVSVVATGLTHLQVNRSRGHQDITNYDIKDNIECDIDIEVDESINKHVAEETFNSNTSGDSGGSFSGYKIPEQESLQNNNEHEDYFHSFYEGANDVGAMGMGNESKNTSNTFVPRKAIDIERKAKPSESNGSKFDLKSIFKINRGS